MTVVTSKEYERVVRKAQEGQELSGNEAKIFASYMNLASPEERMLAWSFLQENSTNLFKVHPHIESLMVDTVVGNKA